MSQTELAKRYAKALLELGHQKGRAKAYQAQIASVAQVIAEPDVFGFYSNTAVTHEVKRKSLEKLLGGAGFDDDVKGFLRLLLENQRVTHLPEIVKACQALLDMEEGITRGKLRSATALGETVRADYERKIGQILKKKIYLESTLDSKIMGGVRVEIGGWTFDDSLETHLGQLGEALLKQT
ncbi:MAG: ATP synthase F1 subunit delta [Bdellovibrionales bacterium]